jgi:cysteine desulfurase / selenocysteine lyase
MKYFCIVLLLPLVNVSAFQSATPRRRGLPNFFVSQSKVLEHTATTDGDEWWRAYKLDHADVAAETRNDFAILKTTVGDDRPLIYLDSAATSQKPKAVTDALTNYYETQNANVHRGAHTLAREATASYEEARDLVATFVNAHSRNEIVFTKGATEAINLVTYSYGRSNLMPGDEIIVTEMEHHANMVPWQILAKETGALLKFVHINKETGMLDCDEMERLLSPKTKLVGFQHVSNVMACVNPIADMVRMIRAKSPQAKILLDACQSVPHMAVDVQELGVDFLAASGHKMCAPTGIGFLWAREELLNEMPPFLAGGEMIDQVTLEGSTYAPAPGRFEAGTPAIAQAIGLGAAIKYLNKVGMDRISAYEHELGDYLYKRMSEMDGLTVLGPKENRAALCAFCCDDVHPSDLSTFLDIEGIAIRAGHHCCQPLHKALGISHSARASLYFYNTKE